MHDKRLPLVGVVSMLFVAFGLGTVGRAHADFSVNVSGHETSKGKARHNILAHRRFW